MEYLKNKITVSSKFLRNKGIYLIFLCFLFLVRDEKFS